MARVEQVDESALRFTQDVDLVVRREDLDRAGEALAKAGFIRRRVAGIERFLDGPDAKARDAVHVISSGEQVRPEYLAAVPEVAGTVSGRTRRAAAAPDRHARRLTAAAAMPRLPGR